LLAAQRGAENALIVGASLLAMVVNVNARIADESGVVEFFASRLAPTGLEVFTN